MSSMESQDPLSNSSFPQADSIYEDTDADDVDSIYQYKASVHVMKTLNVMRENGEFCDLVIEMSNTKFQVHQTVIAVWSPVLKNLLQCQTGRQHVHISYDKPEVFKHLLSFVYTGTFQDETPNIPAILLLAATFQIQLLKELCVEHLKSTVTADNVISLYHLAGKYQLPDLKHHCLDILRQHLPEVAQKHELRELSPRQINSFLGCELVSKKLDPEMKLFLIISWLTEDVSGRQQYLVLLLGHIDWSVVAADFLEEISQTENFFTSNPASLYLLLQTLHSSNISLGPYEKQFQSLREQYSYLLSSVVSGSVISGPTKADKFKPVRFTLISHSKEGVVSMNRQGSSKEDEDTEDFNMDESCNEDDLYYDNVDQSVSKHEQAKSSNITVSSPFTLAGSEIPLQPSLTRDDGLVSDPFPETATSTTCSSNTSSTVEGSMKRKRVRPRRFITDIDTVMGEVVPKSNESRTRKDHKTKSSKQNLEHKRESSSSLTFNEAAGHETGRPARTKKVVQIGTEKQKTYNSDLSETEGKPTGISQKESETAAESEQGEVTVSGAKKQDSPIQGKRKRGRPPKSVKAKTSLQFTQIKDIATQRTRNASNGKSQEQMQTEKKSEAKLQLLTCSYCDFTTCSRSKLMRHHKKVHEGNCLFCCNLCSFVSKWSKEYHDHMKEKHFPGPPFRCDGDQCSFSADKLQLLLSHRKEHGDPRPFVCDICLMAFRSKSNLYAHFKIHSDEKKHECPECHRCFKVKNTLDQHMVTHSDLRPYLCDLCGFSTKFQSHLISHKRTHTGDVYKCNIPNCSYSTPKKSQLRSHMRSHLGIRPHVCSTCGKAFVEKSHLIRHERIHSAERTFICNQCDYSSTRGDKLREHQQKHHSQDTERAKKAKTGKSKKSGAGNSNKKQVTLPSHENSLVEVVLVKNKKKKTAQNQRNEAIMRAVVGSAGGASLDSQFQFQPLLGESVTGSSMNEQVGNMARMMENSIDRMVDGGRQELLTKGVKHESERQLSTAEILERMGLSMADVTSGGDPVFSYGSQTDTNTSQRNLASDRQTTIVSTSSFPDSKQMVTNQTSYQLQQQNMLPGNIRVPTFSAINTSSQSAALNSQFGHLVQPQVNLVPIATPDPSSVIPLLSDPPIMVPSSRGSSSLPTHNYHYHQQQQPHHMCQNQQQAQQQHQQHAESSSLPRIGDYLL